MKHRTLVFILLLFCTTSVIAKDSTSNKSYILNAHIGVDLAKGLRLGLLVYVKENFSIETSYGKDVIPFLIPSEQDTRYSLGVNWHKGLESNLIIGISFSHGIFPQAGHTSQNFISANVGSFIINKTGIRFYYKGGILYGFKKDDKKINHVLFPNIDIGISYNIF